MNKNHIKNSLQHIKPDPHLKTRLEAKVNSVLEKRKTKLGRLTVSTAVLCGLIVFLSVSAGIGLSNIPHNTTNANLSNNYANETASIDGTEPTADLAELLYSQTESTEETTNGVAYSVPPIETQVHYHQVLLVNGKDIAPENYVKFYEIKNYAELPLTAILEEFGATVTWQSDTEAIINLKGKNYTLDAEKCTLKEENSNLNLLTPIYAPGTSAVTDIPMYRTYGDDFIVDNYTLQGALTNLGFSYTVKVDYKAETAIIK